MNKDWFLSRELRVLEYQETAIQKVQDSLSVNEKTLLAACPSAGKTLMTIYILEEYLKANPNNKIIVLAHGTTVLRTQFHDVLEQYKPDFSYQLIENSDDYNSTNADVVICLPQTLKNIKLRKADLLVVDEAHHFYISSNATMIKNIIRDSGVSKQLLLTGTPSRFILENLRLNRKEYNIIPVTLNTIYDAGMVSEAYVEVASSTYQFSLDDYNNDCELKTSVNIKSVDTNATLDDLVEKIVVRLKSFRGNNYTNITPDWKILLKSLKKTMIACRSIQQAQQIKRYFDKRNIDSALSTSENDTDSLEIKRFKDQDDCLVLIVVYRGILGFNMEKLVNVVDMTTSNNIDRIYQLFSRVIRVDKNKPDQKKLFFKISPNMLTDYYKHIMTAVLMLSHEEFFTKFNGKNFNDMQIPVKKVYKGKIDDSEEQEDLEVGSKPQKTRKYQPIDMEGLPVFEFFKNIFHKKDELLTTYCMTTIRDVRAEFMKIMPSGYWTKEKCLESALKYNNKRDWQKIEGSAHATSLRNEWYKECTAHMTEQKKPNGYWTKEKCLESASKYSTKEDWAKNESTIYNAAYNNGWFEECTTHMIELRKPNSYWTKEKCLESALKYNTKKDWKQNCSNAYGASLRNEWYKECTAHMTEQKKPNGYWTKELCVESALKFDSIKKWIKNESSAYNAARKNDWLPECTKHIEEIAKPKNYWTKDSCIKSALEYETKNEWIKNESSAYNASLRNEWHKECTAHMTELQKPNGYWTKELCVESASKYNSITKWLKIEGSGAYKAARKNGWLDECTAHMKKNIEN